MSKSKRLLAVFLAVVLCISMTVVGTVSANAQADITVSAVTESAEVKQGDTLTVEIKLASEDVLFSAGDFGVAFDADVLSVESTDGMVTSYTAGSIVENADNLSVSNPKEGELKVLYCDETNEQNGQISANGTLVTVDFTVLSDAPAGEHEITLAENGDFVVPDETDGFISFTVAFEGLSFAVAQPPQPTTTQKPIETTAAPTTPAPTTTGTQTPTDGTSTEPAKLKLKKVKKVKAKSKKRKTVKVTWKKVKNAKKYVVKYSYKKNMKKAKFKRVKKTRVTLKKLKSGKKVYIRVRAVNGKVKGKFSTRKSVKVK